jgi:protein-histidine pros-kinase
MRILLADDQEDIRSLTTIQLERSGHHVTSVPDGKTALKAAQRDRFDVALLDEEMPGLTGVQVARAICENAKTREGRPILIALTGNNSPEDRDRLRAAGFDSVIAKPFRLETLATLLRDPARIPADAAPPDQAPSSEPGSFDDILKRIGGDKKLLCQMIATFLHDTPKRLAAIQKMLKRGDGVELSSYAHALKGSVSIFGAAHARQHSQALQDLGRIGDFAEANRVYPLLQEEIAKLLEKLRGYAEQAGPRPAAKIARAKSRAKAARSPRRSPGKKRRKPGTRRKK